MPQDPLAMLPVVGLPPQVTVQSTPRPLGSFDGVIFSDIFEPMESAEDCAIRPLPLVIVIGVAVGRALVPCPQPARATSNRIVPLHVRWRVEVRVFRCMECLRSDV